MKNEQILNGVIEASMYANNFDLMSYHVLIDDITNAAKNGDTYFLLSNDKFNTKQLQIAVHLLSKDGFTLAYKEDTKEPVVLWLTTNKTK